MQAWLIISSDILWPAYKSPSLLFDQDLVVNFATYTRVYTVNLDCKLLYMLNLYSVRQTAIILPELTTISSYLLYAVILDFVYYYFRELFPVCSLSGKRGCMALNNMSWVNVDNATAYLDNFFISGHHPVWLDNKTAVCSLNNKTKNPDYHITDLVSCVNSSAVRRTERSKFVIKWHQLSELDLVISGKFAPQFADRSSNNSFSSYVFVSC